MYVITSATLLLFILLGISDLAAQVAPVAFSAADTGTFPAGWKTRDDGGRTVYTVRAEGDRTFLHAESNGNGHQIGFELSADPKRLPILRFSWRALKLPLGGNELQKQTNDSALGVYLEPVPNERFLREPDFR